MECLYTKGFDSFCGVMLFLNLLASVEYWEVTDGIDDPKKLLSALALPLVD